MTTSRRSPRGPSARTENKAPIAEDPGFRALLDHLGRLIAKEYLVLLRRDGDHDSSRKKGPKR